MKNKSCFTRRLNQNKLSCRKVVMRHLRIFVSVGMINERKEIRRSRIETFRDDRLLLNNSYGFTLIELLAVVLIIGILAAVALPQYQKAVGKARFAELISFGNAIQKAEEAYYLANGAYTSRMDELSLEVSQNNYSMQLSNSYFIIARNGFAPYYVMYFERHPSTIFQGRKECRVSNNQLNSITRQICAGVTGANEGTGDNYSLWVFQK